MWTETPCPTAYRSLGRDYKTLTQEAYLSMDPEFVESAAVNSLRDRIRDWEVQSLVHMHSRKNITAALAYALKVETARRASCRSRKVTR